MFPIGSLVLVWDGSKASRELRNFCPAEIESLYEQLSGHALAWRQGGPDSDSLLVRSPWSGSCEQSLLAACRLSLLLRCVLEVQTCADDAAHLTGALRSLESEQPRDGRWAERLTLVCPSDDRGARRAQRRLAAQLQEAGALRTLLPPASRYACVQLSGGRLLFGRLRAEPASRIGAARSDAEHDPGSATSMPPLLAGLTATFAGVFPGSAVLDPCCGSGSLLAAARSQRACGLAMGSDALAAALPRDSGDPRCDWLVQDARRLADSLRRARYFDAVVADPPYGVRAAAHGSDAALAPILAALISLAGLCLVPGGRMAVWLPAAAAPELEGMVSDSPLRLERRLFETRSAGLGRCLAILRRPGAQSPRTDSAAGQRLFSLSERLHDRGSSGSGDDARKRAQRYSAVRDLEAGLDIDVWRWVERRRARP